jgi:CubicO group peptidase (beta-lactamase class C family)
MKIYMARRAVFLLILLPAIGVWAQISHTDSQSPTASQSLEAKIDVYLKPYLDMGVFSGSLLVAQKGKILLSKGYGMADYEHGVPNSPQTKFQVASISKIFTAIAIGILENKGLLSRNDPLKKFIPDFPNGERITLNMLIRHRSGVVGDLTDFKTPQSLAQVVEQIKRLPLGYEPGTRGEYSNHGYRLLAYVIEQVSKQSYGQFLKENIFDPLGLQNTGHTGPETILANRARGYVPAGTLGFVSAPYIDWTMKTGNGSLYSTAEDLYKWEQAIRVGKIAQINWLEQLLVPAERFKRRMLGISGGAPGFSARMEHYPTEDVSVVLLMNNYATTAIPIVRDVAAMVFGEPYEITQLTKPVKVESTLLAAYAGTYQYGRDFFAPNAKTLIGLQDGQLTVTSRGTTFMLVPQSDTKFFDRFGWATITFVKDEKGNVSHFVWRYDGRDYPAQKVNP